jgi:hypothetical protein
MSDPRPAVRRIVTGHDDRGVATIVEDGPAPVVRTVAERPGYRVTELWATSASPADIDAPDRSALSRGVLPPEGGTVIRIIDFPPEPSDPEQRVRGMRATFGTLYPDAGREGGEARHPGMHRTDTVDYALVLSGEVTAVLDDTETVMRAGDVLIQRGTNHAWANRSGQSCRIAFVLIDGQRRASGAGGEGGDGG